MSTPLSASEDPSWGSYPNTVLVFSLPSEDLRVDLGEPLGAQTRDRIRELANGRPFVVLTACNPRGQVATESMNAESSSNLLRRVKGTGCFLAPARGESPDGVHQEPGAVCALELDDAIALACELGQSALFWFDGDTFWLVGALVEAAPLALPVRRRRDANA